MSHEIKVWYFFDKVHEYTVYKVNGVTCESLSVGIFVFPALVISFKTI